MSGSAGTAGAGYRTPVGGTPVQLCPKCHGQGIVSKPPWLAGDRNEWASHTTAPYVCNLCDGDKVIPLIARDAVPGCTTLGCPNPGTVPGVFGADECTARAVYCTSCAGPLTFDGSFVPDLPPEPAAELEVPF